jgi:hypothetical protein
MVIGDPETGCDDPDSPIGRKCLTAAGEPKGIFGLSTAVDVGKDGGRVAL